MALSSDVLLRKLDGFARSSEGDAEPLTATLSVGLAGLDNEFPSVSVAACPSQPVTRGLLSIS